MYQNSAVGQVGEPVTVAVLGRSVWYGGLAGGIAGALVGTGLLPVIGTIFGALYGAVVGLAMGLINSPGMLWVASTKRSRTAARVVASLVSLIAGIALSYWWFHIDRVAGIRVASVMGPVCFAIGWFLGPRAAFGKVMLIPYEPNAYAATPGDFGESA